MTARYEYLNILCRDQSEFHETSSSGETGSVRWPGMIERDKGKAVIIN